MNKRNIFYSASFFSLLITILFYSCSPSIALYDQYAYEQATSLKVDLQNLALESDSTTFTNAKTDVDKVNVELQKAYEYDKGRTKDSISTKQYEILLSDKDFYKTFLRTWQTHEKVSGAAAEEYSIKIGQLMDQIIKLENGKNKQ